MALQTHAAGRNRSTGLSVFEVLITLTVLGILAALAVPSFREAALNGASTAQSNDLATAFSLARSEATKQAVSVRVSAVGGDWQAGWEVATDRNRSGTIDGADVVLRIGDQAREGFIWVVQDQGGGAVADVWFNASGRLVGMAQPVVVTIRRPDGDASKSRRLCIALSGRLESKKGEGSCL